MEIVGYLITLAFLRDNPELLQRLEDFSLTVDSVGNLANRINSNIKHHRAFLTNLDEIRNKGYVRKGNVGMYYSNNLRNYIFNGNVSRHEEGAILELDFKLDPDQPSDNDWIEVYENLKAGDKETINLFLRRSNKVNEKVLQRAIDEHLDEVEERNRYG